MTREDDFLAATWQEYWGEMIRHLTLLHDWSLRKEKAVAVDGVAGRAMAIPAWKDYYLEYPNTAWIEPYIKDNFSYPAFRNIFPASWWDGKGRDLGGSFGIKKALHPHISIDHVNGLMFEPMYDEVNFQANQDWASPHSFERYKRGENMEAQLDGLPSGLPDFVEPAPAPVPEPEPVAPPWWSILTTHHTGLLGLPPAGLTEYLPEGWIKEIAAFVLPLNALSKLILGESIYEGEAPELSTDDYIELAVAVLLLAGGAGLGAKLASKFGAAGASSKVAKGVVKAVEKDHKDAVKLGEAAITSPVYQGKTAEEFAYFAVRNAPLAGTYMARMGREKFFKVLRLLEKTPHGRMAISALFKSMYEARKPLLTKFLEHVPEGMKAVLYIAGSIVGADLVLGYVGKEIPEAVGMGVWALIEAKDWEEAWMANERYLRFIEAVEEMPGQTFLRGFPIIGEYWNLVSEAQKTQYQEYKDAIEPNLIRPAVLTVNTNVPALFRIDGKLVSNYPTRMQKIETYPIEETIYTLTIEAEDHQTVAIEYKAGPGATKSIDVVLPEGVTLKGILRVNPTPINTLVYIGENLMGTEQPYEFSLAPGTYSVKLTKTGFYDKTFTAYIKEGETYLIEWAMVETPPPEEPVDTANITFESEPTRASVFVDGLLLDFPTPIVTNLKADTYEIRMEKPGYEPGLGALTVTAKEDKAFKLTLKEIPGPRVWRVYVTTVPSGAKILVNGAFTGDWTPGYVDLAPGQYRIGVEKPGYLPDSAVINLE